MRTSLLCGLCFWLTVIPSANGQEAPPLPTKNDAPISGGLTQSARDERSQLKPSLEQKLAELKTLQAEIAQLRHRLGLESQVVVELKIVEIAPDKLTELGMERIAHANALAKAEQPASDNQIVQTAASSTIEPMSATVAPFQVIATDVSLESRIEDLRRRKLLRILAEPTLVATIGRRASFLSGGEFPLLIPHGDDVTVEWCELGTRIEVTPLLLSDGRVRLELDARFRERDDTSAVVMNGTRVPGLTTRRFRIQVELKFGQTVAVRGMNVHRKSAGNKETVALIRCKPADAISVPAPADGSSGSK